MSNAGQPRAFDPTEERTIPPWPFPGPPPSTEVRVYVLGVQIVNGSFQFHFIERPQTPDPEADGPLDIRVPKDCTIVLRLDDALDWEYRHDNAVVLGPMNYPDNGRYFNLAPVIVNGRCREVQFNALFLKLDDYTNRDPYALYVNLIQQGVPQMIRIDPDIINPGDHHI